MWDIGRLVGVLESFYGRLPYPPTEPFAFYVWQVLSFQSTPARAEAAQTALKRMRALTPDAMHGAAPARLQASVALAGPYLDARLRALRRGVDVFRRTPGLTDAVHGPLPSARRAIESLPKVGEAGVRRMLLFAGDHLVFPVDARVQRVATRIGLVGARSASQRAIERAVMERVPRSPQVLRRAFLYLSHHGAATCTEDPHCRICPLQADCPEGRRRGGVRESVAGGPRHRTPASTE